MDCGSVTCFAASWGRDCGGRAVLAPARVTRLFQEHRLPSALALLKGTAPGLRLWSQESPHLVTVRTLWSAGCTHGGVPSRHIHPVPPQNTQTHTSCWEGLWGLRGAGVGDRTISAELQGPSMAPPIGRPLSVEPHIPEGGTHVSERKSGLLKSQYLQSAMLTGRQECPWGTWWAQRKLGGRTPGQECWEVTLGSGHPIAVSVHSPLPHSFCWLSQGSRLSKGCSESDVHWLLRLPAQKPLRSPHLYWGE